MYNELKNIFRHGSIYMLGIILGRAISFLMIPIYTNYLTPEDYGLLQLLSLTIDVVSTLFGLGMASAVVRTYQQFDEEPAKRSVISSSLLGSITIMGIVTASCLLLSPQLSELIFSTTDNTGYFRLTFIAMFFTSGIELPMIFLRIKLRSGSFVVISLLKLTLQLSLNIWFLVGLGLGVESILYSNVISAAVFALYLTYSTLKQVGIRFDIAKYTEMLKFGMPLIVSDISSFMLTYSDRYFLNYMTDLATVGVYSLAYTFGMILSFLVNGPFMSVWGTEMFKYGKQPNGKLIFAKVLIYYLLLSLTICLGLSLLTKDALRIMANESYWSAYKYVPLISLSYVLNGVLYISGAGILLAGKTKYRAYSTAIAMSINLLMNFLLIPSFGAWGAAIATFAAYIVRLTIDVFYSQRLYHVLYDFRRIALIGVLFSLILFGGIYIEIENIVVSVTVNIVAVLMFPFLAYMTGVLTAEEKHWVLRFCKNPVAAVKDFRAGAI